MFVTLFVKEVINHLQTFRFGAALVTAFALVSVSAWVLGEDYRERLNAYNVLSESYAAQAREVYVPSQISPVIHRAPGPLAIFAQGSEGRLGNSVQIKRWEVPRHAEENLMQNKLLLGLPAFDLLSIFTIVFSVFGILLSFDAICGERERGTLKQVCSYPVPRATLFLSKYLAAVAVLAVPFAISLLSALIILLFALGISFSGAEWGAIALMALAGLLFAALFVAVGTAASALVKRSSTALLLGLVFWSVTVLIVPSLAPAAAAALVPLEQPQEVRVLEQKTWTETDSAVWKWAEDHAPNAGSGWGSSGFGGEDPWLFDAPPQWFHDAARFVAYIEPIYRQRAERIWNVVKRHLSRKEQQSGLADSLGSVSPAHLLRRSFTALASTDYATYADFMEQARRYRSALIDSLANRGLFTSKVYELFSRRPMAEIESESAWQNRRNDYEARRAAGEAGFAMMSIKNYGPLPENYAPQFVYRNGGPRTSDALAPIGFLAVYVLIILAAGFAAFARYRVA